MAAVLDAFAPFVKKLVEDMAKEEVSKLLGVSGEITKLGSTMEDITAWVSDAESKRITDTKVQEWVNRLKDAMYDGADILELCQLEAEERRELEEGLGEGGNREQNLLACFQPLQVWLQNPVVTLITCGGVAKMKAFFQSFLFCLRNPVFADEISSRIKELNERLEGINKEAENNFKFQRYLDSSNPEPRKLTYDAESSIYETGSYVDESTIVGQQIESDTRALVRVLTTDDNKNHQDLNVVSIVGTGGMGKSTLAQKIFSDATIHEHFKTKIWLSITKHFDGAELLWTAIENAGGHHGGRKDKSTLMKTLEDTLSTKGRFLLVMDDVWDNKAWEHVLQHLINIASKKQPGSRVLLTTRKEDVAEQMLAFWYQHEVRPLNEDDAWSLLMRQLHPEKVRGIDQLKSLGMEILKRCDGLPLAIKVIGGVLNTKRAIENDWKSVLNDPAWSLTGVRDDELDKRLYLSYQDLSPQLKQCFLYCSLIPRSEPIVGRIIADMWISEGFIQPQDGTISVSHGLQEMAIENYQKLIKRNLIEPEPNYSYTLQRCKMHDVVRSFAEYMAREESLVVVGREKQAANPGMHVRRLSMEQTEEWKILQRQESLRTLIMRNSNLPGDSLASFSSLRILHIFYFAECDTLVTSLSKFKHLRYLHLEDTDISRLPDDIHNMKFLQHIHLQWCEKLCYLPESIIKLKHLRSLNLHGSNVSVVPKGFAGLTNMISLVGFPVHLDNSWCSLQELAPLSQLRTLGLRGLWRMNDSHMVEMGMLSRMGHLKSLFLQYDASGYMMSQSVAEEVLEKLCPPTCIEEFEFFGGYVGRQLPKWMHAQMSEDFKSLLTLRLENLPFCTQLPDGLCCLPSLKLLVIRDAPSIESIGREFQASSSSAAFPKLVVVQLAGLSACEKWEWDHCDEATIAMPCLETLIIKNCSRLRCLPPGLASDKRHALRHLALYNLSNLTDVENFPSVVELHVFDCPDLKRISEFHMLHKICIKNCPKLEVLEGVPELDRLVLQDTTMDTLPGYLRAVSPRFLDLTCNMKLYEFLTKDGCSEFNKIASHIESTKITGRRYD